MAIAAEGLKAQVGVAGVRGVVVILQVAGNAFRRKSGIGALRMALAAFGDVVAFLQRKKVMVDVAFPAKPGHGVAIDTVCRVSTLYMVRFRCPVIVGPVTINAFHSVRLKAEEGGRRVTVAAGGCIMCTNQRETTSLVKTGDVFHNPGPGIMTVAAVGAYGLFMNVGMALVAFGQCF